MCVRLLLGLCDSVVVWMLCKVPLLSLLGRECFESDHSLSQLGPVAVRTGNAVPSFSQGHENMRRN